MQSTQEVDYGKIKEKYGKYLKFYNSYKYSFMTIIIAPLAILLGLGRVDQPFNFEFRLLSLIVAIVHVVIVILLHRESKKYRQSLAEISFMRSFEVVTNLKSYAEKELHANKSTALKALKKLIANHDNKWLINQKAVTGNIDDFDLLMNPTVKLVLILQNTYLPLIEKGEKKDLVEVLSYFEKARDYFHYPTETSQKDLFDAARASPLKKEEKKQAQKSLLSSTWVRHFAVFSGSIIAGFVAFFLLTPLSPENIFQPLGVALVVTFGIAGVYAGFLRKQN